VLEDDRAVAVEMLGKANPVVAREQLFELTLALFEWRRPLVQEHREQIEQFAGALMEADGWELDGEEADASSYGAACNARGLWPHYPAAGLMHCRSAQGAPAYAIERRNGVVITTRQPDPMRQEAPIEYRVEGFIA
jgi:hypothetical protein